MMTHKALLIAHGYPPCHAIGALRAAKFAKYLPRCGWEPTVVTRLWQSQLGLEEPSGIKVVRTHFQDRLRFFRRDDAGRRARATQDLQASSGNRGNAVRAIASFLLKECLAYPDESIGWKPYALEAAREMLCAGGISLIFSTSPPATSHLIASQLQCETGLPWVADFRDLWTQNHYVRHAFPRTLIERRLEKRILQGASLLITVSEPFADELRRFHGKPTEVITNGYDEDDYSGDPPSPTPYFSLTYTGQIYAGKRDPSLLFDAVRDLAGEQAISPEAFRIRFFGPERDRTIVYELAERYGIRRYVTHGGQIPYREAILRQRESTALLLLNWNVPEEKGVYTGKLFEYLGARRPILAVPRLDGVVDELMSEANAGVVAGTKQEIVRALEGWYDQFVDSQAVPYNGIETVIRRFTKRAQTEKLAKLFDRLANNKGIE